MRKTKIVATIGPASQAPSQLEALIRAGVDVVRMNFSHGSHDFHRQTFRTVRAVSEAVGKPVSILQDLQGPKIRVGKLPGGSIALAPGDAVTFDCVPGAEAGGGRIPCDYPGLPGDVAVGDPVLLDDGKFRLEVTGVGATEVHARVIEGGQLSERKGLNLPASNVRLPALTEKDKIDLQFGAFELGVDLVALSFVRNAADIAEAQALSNGIPIIAKIEKPQALANIDAILKIGAGVMVARGDLGVEYPLRKVPLIQKDLIEKTNARGKIVIVATQMLESMIERAVPTRAEVSDVANAVLDGADAVMLSAETASGKYPVESVRTMAEIIVEVEESARFKALPEMKLQLEGSTVSTAVARAAAAAANQLGIKTIVVYTRSGNLAQMVSEYRPAARIFAYTPQKQILTRLPVLWGVSPRLAPEAYRTTEYMVRHALADLVANGDVHKHEQVIVVSPTPPDRKGHGSSMMQVVQA